MNSILIFNTIVLLFLFLYLYFYSKRFDVVIVVGLYLLSSFTSLFFDPYVLPSFRKSSEYPGVYFLLFGSLIFYSLSPLIVISRRNKSLPQISNLKISNGLRIILFILSVGGVYSFFYQLPFAAISLSKGAQYIRSVVLTSGNETVLPKNIFTTVAVAFSTFFPIYILFFWISIKQKLSIINKIGLGLGSLSYIVTSFCFTSRDGVVLFGILLLIIISNLWSEFNKKFRRVISLTIILILPVIVYFLFDFTKDRFGDSDENFVLGTTGYIAQQPYVFSENILRREVSDYFYGVSFRFPVFSFLENPKVIERTEPYEWTFGTALTDYYTVSGFNSLFIIVFIITSFFRYQFKKVKYNNHLSFSLIYILYMHYIVSSVFYFILGSFSGNVYILVLLVSFFVSKKLNY